MKKEDQVCALKQAKRLKELGVQNGSYFSWQHYPAMIYRNESIGVINSLAKESVTDPGESWPAFTVAELGVMLPVYINVTQEQYPYRLTIWNNPAGLSNEARDWRICYESKFGEKRIPGDEGIKSANEAICRAAILIHLLENNLLSVEEVNQRLEA